jgi:inosose dehydratase
MGDVDIACHSAAWGSENFVEAVGDIANVGFHGIETLPTVVEAFEDRPQVLSEILEQNELRFVAVLSSCGPMSTLSLEEEIERNLNIARFLTTMNAPYLVMYPPTITEEEVIEEEDYQFTADAINEIGLQAQEMGVRLCLHPNFGTICESPQQIRLMLELTNANYVSFCLDTAYFQAIKVNPASFYRDHHDRVGYMHFRDLRRVKKPRRSKQPSGRKERGEPIYTNLGKGSVNFQRLVDFMTEFDYTGWVTLELDPKMKKLRSKARAALEYCNVELDLVL